MCVDYSVGRRFRERIDAPKPMQPKHRHGVKQPTEAAE